MRSFSQATGLKNISLRISKIEPSHDFYVTFNQRRLINTAYFVAYQPYCQAQRLQSVKTTVDNNGRFCAIGLQLGSCGGTGERFLVQWHDQYLRMHFYSTRLRESSEFALARWIRFKNGTSPRA